MIIHDPTLITKHNPSGVRPATQPDIDHLQRVSVAYAHVIQSLRALVASEQHTAPAVLSVIAQAKSIVANEPAPSMSEAEMAAYMASEDARTGVDKHSGVIVLDADGNLVDLASGEPQSI